MNQLQHNKNTIDRICDSCLCLGLFLIFALQSLPNLQVGFIQLHIEQVLLLIMTPLILLKDKVELESKTVRLLLGLLLWVSIVNTVFKSPVYSNLKVIKNALLPFVLSYLLCANLINGREGVRKVIVAVALGIAMFLLIVAMQADFSDTLVRQATNREFRETFGATYVWVGYISGVLCIFSFCLFFISKGVVRFLWLLAMLFGSFMCLFSGCRAVLAGIPLSVIMLAIIRRCSSNKVMMVFIGIIILTFVMVMSSEILSAWLPDPQVGIEDRKSELRLINSDAWFAAVQCRLKDWIGMLPEFYSYEFVVGVDDYEESLLNAKVLMHPHNVMIWMEMVGGIGAVIIFSVLMVNYFKSLLFLLSRPSDRQDGFLATAVFSLFLITWLVINTNNWAGPISTVMGISIAFVEKLNEHSR